MDTMTITTRVNAEGHVQLDLPLLRNRDVEITVREVAAESIDQMAIFDIPLLFLDPRHSALSITSRAELYDDNDDGR